MPLPNLQFQYGIQESFLQGPASGEALFTDNESASADRRFAKDGFHRFMVHGEQSVNPEGAGSKACLRYRETIPPGGSFVLRLRLTNELAAGGLREVDKIVTQRRKEADEFYASIAPPSATEEERLIQRSALAGMLWSKQIYLFDVDKWLSEGAADEAAHLARQGIRNVHWRHLNSMRILAVPDRWEYPWFAAWDLAFQCVAIALVDPAFAKENLWLLLFEQFQHPNGQIPAYEWEFSDLNPPVHAWACWRVYEIERSQTGNGDVDFLKKTFHKLLINFAWWVNRVDSQGNNIFEGGFLGLDNITVVDRSTAQGSGIILEQSDATGWMAFFCLNLMKIALELSKSDSTYEVLATKFFEHFVYISAAMKKMGGRNYQLWDEQDGFFYDVLRYPNGDFHKFRVRSLVGLIPLYAIEVLHHSQTRAAQDIPVGHRMVHPQPPRSGWARLLRHRGRRRTALRAGRCRSAAPVAHHGPLARSRRVPVAGRNPQPVQVSSRASLPFWRRHLALRTGGIGGEGERVEIPTGEDRCGFPPPTC